MLNWNWVLVLMRQLGYFSVMGLSELPKAAN